ncbi:Mandelate racemase [Paraburkholderia hiiakae]|uniref:Mandelate racemase n=1 Tax=Paraburkholderia hiiakae TaxID=1081782 RepID=A0ABN7HS02_9BURK|nr:enolase C-terminal domain-like protein [Paraburkholderia hiiakae]CAD6533720.1 Mandelate racemase [Paraburkholderia hiiakae]
MFNLPTGLTVREVQARAVLAPLKTPLVTPAGSFPKAPLVLIDLHTEEGITGRAYLMANSPVALKAMETLVLDLGATLVGQKVVPVERHEEMRSRFTLIGGSHGLANTAISGLDVALWDALAIAANLPLATLIGGRPQPLKAYNSLGMIRASGAAEEAEKSLSAGFNAIKFKIGWPTFAEDLAAVRAFREAAPDVELMVDYNQSLTTAEALRRGHALESEGLAWIEEPIRCDDFAGFARIAAELKTPLQIGENFSGVFDMERALRADASDYVMCDVQMIGGVTGWLRAAALAQVTSKNFSSHCFVEASAHLLTVTPTRHWLEFLDVAGGILAEPPKVVNGTVTAPDCPGVGLVWDEAAVAKARV